MTRSSTYLLVSALLLGGLCPLWAQQAPDVGTAMIIGLSNGDQLNVRASASAIGLVIGRLPNGAQVRTFECEDVSGNRWCKVEDVQTKQVTGWAPARYLSSGNSAPDSAPTGPAAAEDMAVFFNEGEDMPPLSELAPDRPENAALEKGVLAALSENIIPNAAAATASGTELPESIRSASKPVPALTPEQKATPEERAMARIGAMAVLPYATVLPEDAFVAAEAEPDAALDRVEISASDASGVPLPEARPGLPQDAAAVPEGETVQEPEMQAALAEETTGAIGASATQPFDATGTIACARYVGQPMKPCEAMVNRSEKGEATVTVSWPDGGKRIIRFQQGRPEGSDAAGDFRFTREAKLNLIRIGDGERFEIVDDLPFGG